MKRFLGCAFGLALAVSACGGNRAAGPSLPKAEVRIAVDHLGMAHIYAQDDEDLFFGYGYQLASDRLLQLEMFRRFAYGRLSEVLGAAGPGSAGQTSLMDDRFARIFNWAGWGRADAAWMQQNEPEQYSLTSAWVAGVNARIAEVTSGAVPPPFGFGPAELKIMPEPWQPEDVYVVQKMAGFGLDESILFEVFITFAERFAPKIMGEISLFLPARQTFVLPPDERPAGQSASLARPPEARPADLRAGHQPAVRGRPRWGAAGAGELAPPPNRNLSAGSTGCRCVGGDARAEMPASFRDALAALATLHELKPLGSNNWAVDGRFTDNGMPLLAGDPHLGYNFSGITYAVHLDSKDAGGTFDAEGFSFVGAPGIFAGHNDKIAWSPTSAFADVMDLWAVELGDGTAKIGGKDVPTVTRHELIGVKGGDPDEIDCIDVPGYGVIMPSAAVGSPIPIAGDGKEVLVGWPGFSARPARYFRELMRAQSLDDFDRAVLRMPEMTYNFVAADAHGIAYRVGVDVPERSKPASGREPWSLMDGSDPAALWSGKTLSADQLPHSRAQTRGFIASANNDPLGFTADGRLDDDPYYYGALFDPGWRAGRIEAELTRLTSQAPSHKLAVADMEALQTDVNSNLADDLVPILAAAYANVPSDASLAEFRGRADLDALVKLLTVDWDRKEARDESGGVAFHAFAHFIAGRIIEPQLTPILYDRVLSAAPIYMLKIAMLALRGSWSAAVLPDSRDRLVLLALDDTAKWLAQRFGGVDPSRYHGRDAHFSSMEGAYGRGVPMPTVPSDGGESTVNVNQSVFLENDKPLDQWISHWGPIERQVVRFDVSGRPESFANFALGNVADPASPHFSDAMASWQDGKYQQLPFERAEVDAAAERRIVLPPAQ